MLGTNRVKEKMKNGQKVIGCLGTLGSTAAVEVLAYAGLDVYMIDTEHGPFDVETALKLIMAAEIRGMTPMVRVKDGNRNSILKMLDVGAMGILIPFVKTVDEVKQIVNYGKYQPVGDRGFGTAHKAGFGHEQIFEEGGVQAYFQWANENTLIIPQCETAEALDCIEEIAAIDGVDGIFVGPFDLSNSLGIPKEFENPEFIKAQERVIAACKANNKFCWTLGFYPEHAKKMFEMGYDGVLNQDDCLLTNGTEELVKGIRALGY